MGALQRAAELFGLGPHRSRAEIAAEIAEELALHLELRAKELEEQGIAPDEARTRARELFGDVERTARECAAIQLGGRVMLVRIQWIVIAVLLAAIGVLGVRGAAQRRELLAREMALRAEVQPDHARQFAELEAARNFARAWRWRDSLPRWLAALVESPDDARSAWETLQELRGLSPDDALAALTELWPGLSVTQKQQALKLFAFEHGHPRILSILHLGATDGSLEVQSWAFQYLRDYSFRNFAEDYEGYLQWAETWRDRPLAEVLAENARAFLRELQGRSPIVLAERLHDFGDLDFRPAASVGLDLAQAFRDAGALRLVDAWIRCPELFANPSEAYELAFSWAKSLAPDEAWLRANVLPYVNSPDEELASHAARALGDPRNGWAVPELLARLVRTVPGSDASSANSADWAAAMVLAEIGDPSVIPTLIGLIASNPGYNTNYGLGYFALGELTGVTYDESHDGTWWIDWWAKNQARFPPEVRALPIPQY